MAKKEKVPGSKKSPDKKTRDQKKKEKEKMELMHYLIMSAEKVDEGSSGVVARINLYSLPKRLKRVFSEITGIEDVDSLAVKMLKIYNSGDAKREFEVQKKAQEVLSEVPDAAQVPRPYLYHEFSDDSNEVQDRLREMGMSQSGKKFELILMDFIEGKDLARMLYEEVVKRDKSLDDVSNMVESVDFNTLQLWIQGALGYNRPGGKGNTENERLAEQNAVEAENAEKLYVFLRRKGYQIDKKILQALSDAITQLHKNNIYHRDFHQRNVILSPKGPFIVDFGLSVVHLGDEDDAYIGRGAQIGDLFVKDESLVDGLSSLTLTLEEVQKEELAKASEEIESVNTEGWKFYKPQLKRVLDLVSEDTVYPLSKKKKPSKKDYKDLADVFQEIDDLLNFISGYEPEKIEVSLIRVLKDMAGINKELVLNYIYYRNRLDSNEYSKYTSPAVKYIK